MSKQKTNLNQLGLFVIIISSLCVAATPDFEIKQALPQLPEGIDPIPNIELKEDRSVTHIVIPGFKRRESQYGVTFRNTSVPEKPMTLDKKATVELVFSFIQKHFPTLSSRNVGGIGTETRSSSTEQDVVYAYSVNLVKKHRAIPVLDDNVRVTVYGDKVARISIQTYSIHETEVSQPLLTASECLEKAATHIKHSIPNTTKFLVNNINFGYKGGYRQPYEDYSKEILESFKAVPVYEFYISTNRIHGGTQKLVFDARTAEFIFPKQATGEKKVVIKGPELIFEKEDAFEMFLIAPRDVNIRNLQFELENIPVMNDWKTYSITEIFKDVPPEGFDNHPDFIWNMFSGKTSKTGSLQIESPGNYEIDVVVRQYSPGDRSIKGVEVSINGQPKVMGMIGPNAARFWEGWGTIHLPKGDNRIAFKSLSPSWPHYQIGPVRIRNTDSPHQDSIGLKDLKIVLSEQSRPNYYNAIPPIGNFITQDLSMNLSTGFHNRYLSPAVQKKLCRIQYSCINPGILKIHSLRASFSAMDQDVAERKANEFILIYPDGGSSRKISSEDLGVFVEYVANMTKQKPTPARFEINHLFALCDLAKRLLMPLASQDNSNTQSQLEQSYVRLVQEEIQRLAGSFFLARGKKPPNASLIDYLGPEALWWGTSFCDPERLTPDGKYLDAWENPYVLTYMEQPIRIRVKSLGPNGKDDSGKGDDIEAVNRVSLIN